MTLQTVLGAGGAVGTALAKELSIYTNQIRLVSRNPKKVNPTDILFPADISDSAQLDKAIDGSSIVYLVVGFEYSVKVWSEKWPALIKNVIASCEKHNAKLVFFDNIYMYDREFLGNMTEETPIRPTSIKGEIRAMVANMIMTEVKEGRLTALIARAADFIATKNSVLVELVYSNLKKGKSANWFADAHKIHTFTFVPDAAKATALLGNTPEAYGEVWHLPTDKTPLTGEQWVNLFAKELNVKPKLMVMPPWLLSVMGVFVPVLKEFKEMIYQYDRHYVFNSDKFEKRFDFKPTPPDEAVRAIIAQKTVSESI